VIAKALPGLKPVLSKVPFIPGLKAGSSTAVPLRSTRFAPGAQGAALLHPTLPTAGHREDPDCGPVFSARPTTPEIKRDGDPGEAVAF
jgi:hypothetical protein